MLFERTPHPILAPRSEPSWASGAVFNPGAWYDGERVHLLFRAVPEGYTKVRLEGRDALHGEYGFENYVSSIGYAWSTDGVNFAVEDDPLLRPDRAEDRYGVEDPRISRLDDLYLITYTALAAPAFDSPSVVRIGLATTKDFRSAEKQGIVGPDATDKDAVIFPSTFEGRVAMLHRITPDIQLIYFDDLEQLLHPPADHWSRHLAELPRHVVLRPAEPWEVKKIGAGPTPIRTSEGWLLIYHGVDHAHVYRMGMALLDLDDPSRLIARTRVPVLQPETEFERTGDVPNVVFPEGAVVMGDRLHVYYGAADRVVGHAEASLNDVLDFLRLQAIAA